MSAALLHSINLHLLAVDTWLYSLRWMFYEYSFCTQLLHPQFKEPRNCLVASSFWTSAIFMHLYLQFYFGFSYFSTERPRFIRTTRILGISRGRSVKDGITKDFVLANGSILQTYGHELNITVENINYNTIVYFAVNDDLIRDVLGRNGFLYLVRLGLIDYDSTLYLSKYDEA